MGHLTKPQLWVLVLWSFGIVIAKTCGLTTVSAVLAGLLDKKEDNLRQQLREWSWDKQDKQGKKRSDWDVSLNFLPLLRWIISLWPATERRLVLAMDATSLKAQFVVLVISVVYRGCAIPIAWQVRLSQKAGPWKGAWLQLFKDLAGGVPADWQVLVMADRGLYAKWLYEAIQQNGWHPFLRINQGGLYRPAGPKGSSNFLPLKDLLPQVGDSWSGKVTCFASKSLECTLLACWGSDYKDPWFVLTDLSPEEARVSWYGLRSWVEDFFRDLKRDGWQWQKTRMSDPDRASHLWLALAVATLWTVSVGGAADANLPVCSLENLPLTHIARRTKKRAQQPRILSCFRRGAIIILTALINQKPLPYSNFVPEPWT